MSERPTPEEIIMDVPFCDVDLLDRFREHGYRIVHPDDVPRKPRLRDTATKNAIAHGWNACRTHIFGEGT